MFDLSSLTLDDIAVLVVIALFMLTIAASIAYVIWDTTYTYRANRAMRNRRSKRIAKRGTYTSVKFTDVI